MIGHGEIFQVGGLFILFDFGLIGGAISDDAVIVGFEHELGAYDRSQHARRGGDDGRIFLIPARRFGSIPAAASPAAWNRTARATGIPPRTLARRILAGRILAGIL